MKSRFPKILCCLFLLLLLSLTLPSCSGKEPTDPAATTGRPDSAAANADELIGSWMRLSGDQMEIYTFRRGGELTIYEMESATVVATRQTGRYALIGDQLTIEIGGRRENYSALTDNGRALILDGQILTPTSEPQN